MPFHLKIKTRRLFYFGWFALFLGTAFFAKWRSSFYRFTEEDLLPVNSIVSWESRKAMLQDTLAKYQIDFERVNKIREFAAYHADWSSMCYSGHWFRSIKDFYNYYEVDKGGGCCSMAANYLSELYKEFGYEACTYNMGYPDSYATHVATLVKIRYKDRWIRIVQDASFNFTLTDSMGIPMDFERLLCELQSNKLSDIRILQPSQIYPSETLFNELIIPSTHWTLAKNDLVIARSHGVRFVYKVLSPRQYDQFVQHLGRRYFRSLSKDGLPKNLLYLYLKPISQCESMI
jgi:hypothetical protein